MAVSYKALKKEKKKTKILGCLLALLLASGIGVGAYAFTNYDSLEDKEQTQQVENEDDTSKDEIVDETPSDEVTEDEEA